MNVAGPAFTHVMYANDIMLFAKANSSEVKILNVCLETYYEWSGQRINRNKSGIIFSKMVQRDKRGVRLKIFLQCKRSILMRPIWALLCSNPPVGLKTSNSYRKSLRPDFWVGEVSSILGW